MKKILSRLAQMLVTVAGVSFLAFCLTYLAPGDPALMLLEAGDTIVSQETIEQTRKELGLDKPFIVQYGNWAASWKSWMATSCRRQGIPIPGLCCRQFFP